MMTGRAGSEPGTGDVRRQLRGDQPGDVHGGGDEAGQRRRRQPSQQLGRHHLRLLHRRGSHQRLLLGKIQGLHHLPDHLPRSE